MQQHNNIISEQAVITGNDIIFIFLPTDPTSFWIIPWSSIEQEINLAWP